MMKEFPNKTCGAIFSDKYYYKFSPDSESEIIFKIGKYLVKLRRTKNCAHFWATLYIVKTFAKKCVRSFLFVAD